MTDSTLFSYGRLAIVFGVLAAVVYSIIVTVTLTRLEAISGLQAFDMRPLGYDPEQAVVLLEALGEEGRAYYLNRQIILDTFYPALLALALINAVRWLVSDQGLGALGRAAILCAVAVAVFDYSENLGVLMMIQSWPDVPDGVVYASSVATILKSFLTILAVALVLGVAVASARRRLERG